MKYNKRRTNKDIETFFCSCGTCGSLTDQQIREIYDSKLIIAEHSKKVYQIFSKDLTK